MIKMIWLDCETTGLNPDPEGGCLLYGLAQSYSKHAKEN